MKIKREEMRSSGVLLYFFYYLKTARAYTKTFSINCCLIKNARGFPCNAHYIHVHTWCVHYRSPSVRNVSENVGVLFYFLRVLWRVDTAQHGTDDDESKN